MKTHMNRLALLCAVAVTLLCFAQKPSDVARANPCFAGCFDQTYSACVNGETYRFYDGYVASKPFWDPGSDPDLIKDNVASRWKSEYQNCTACDCTDVHCSYPCKGSRINGTFVDFGPGNWTTKCVPQT